MRGRYVFPLFYISQFVIAVTAFQLLDLRWKLEKFGIPTDSKLLNYREVARNLIKNDYYSGLLEAIDDCAKNPGHFIVLDCPSGSGKTLAGVALRELDCSLTTKLECRFKNMRVVHVVWDDAVCMQKIYFEILGWQFAQHVRADKFFRTARVL
jgi:hypothetical protein